jgi:hypothetical protein
MAMTTPAGKRGWFYEAWLRGEGFERIEVAAKDCPRISEAGTKIRDRGDNVVNLSQGVTCLSCHQPAARYDFVCEKGHGWAPIPFDDQKIGELQKADPRCAKK